MQKKTIKINFKYFGAVFNPEDNFFANFLRQKYNVLISENPDYLFYSVYPEVKEVKDLSRKGDFIKKISPALYLLLKKMYSKLTNFSLKNKFPLPTGNYVKIFFASEYVKPDMNKCDWAFGTHYEENINHPRYMRIPNRVSDHQVKNWGVPPLKKSINFKKIEREKTKFCNFIYSQDIPQRNNFFKILNKYKKVDSPGRCMNNMPPIGYDSPKKSRASPDWVPEKLKFLNKYKFTIAFENFSKPGWITEKLTHPMLVNSIPIYIGHEFIKNEFNTKSFINFHDFKNMKEFVDYIVKVDNDDKLYEKILREPWYNDNKIPRDFDNKRLMRRFKEIFG